MLHCTVAEAQTRMSSYEFAEWMALDNIEPWGQKRADYQAAVVSATMNNVFAQKDSEVKTVDDMLLEWEQAELPPIGDEPITEVPIADMEQDPLLTKLNAAFFAIGGIDKTERPN